MIQPQIEQQINEHFQVDFFELLNESDMHSRSESESHFKLTLVSEYFEGMVKVKRQQEVYKVLKTLIPKFHALALHTYSPMEWDKLATAPASTKCTGGH